MRCDTRAGPRAKGAVIALDSWPRLRSLMSRPVVALPLAAVIPVAVTVAMVPLRSSWSAANIVLVLAAVEVLAAVSGNMMAAGVAIISAAVSYDLFFTRPYGRLSILSGDDIRVVCLLVLVGLVTAIRVRYMRYSLEARTRLLASREAELIAARDAAMTATRAKDSFLSRTSHELRTPLNSVLGFAQLLQMSELSDEDSDAVERILGAGRHLLTLINELIDFARIGSGDLSVSVEPVPLCPLIGECSQLMAPIAAGRSIRISQDCPDPGLAVHADRQRLCQVLVNLISNAVKYTRPGGSVTVSGHDQGAGQVIIVVSDTGPGLSPEDLERVFVPFERLGAERTAVEGTGIGLPLARALTEAMHGQLTASSVPGQGAAFTISLPRSPDPVRVPAPRLAPARPGAGTHATAGASISILYIEDNLANVEVVSRFLQSRPDARLLSVTTGRAGLECAARDVPDVILLDMHLPDMRGQQVLGELKAEPATAAIPVIVLSADASGPMVRRALHDGALAYLTKPVQLAELGHLLDTLVRSR